MGKRVATLALVLLLATSAAFARTAATGNVVIGPSPDLVAFFRAHGIDEQYLGADIERVDIPWEVYLKMNQIGIDDEEVRAELNRLARLDLESNWNSGMDTLTLKVGHLTWTMSPYVDEE